MWTCWSKKRAFLYMEGDMTHPATSAKFLSYIFSTWYLHPSILHVKSLPRVWGSFTLENTFLPNLPGKSSLRMAKYIHIYILMFSIANFQLIFLCVFKVLLLQTNYWKLTILPQAEMRSAIAPHTLKFMTVTAPRSWTDFYGQGLPTKRPPGHQLCASLNRILPKWILVVSSSGCAEEVPFHAWRCHSGCTYMYEKGHFLQGSPPRSAHWCSQLRLVLLISSVQVTWISFAGRQYVKPP